MTDPPRWPRILLAIVAVAALGLMVFLHLTGAIGPDLHQVGAK